MRASTGRATLSPVWRRGLLALIAAETISSLGSLMSAVALPWFVLETTGSTQRMALVLAAESLAPALSGVAGSRVVARLGARRTLLLCDAVSAPVVALVPVLHGLGALSFPLLLALGFLGGVPWSLHAGSQYAIVPELLGEDGGGVARATASLQMLGRLSYFAGPVLGGVLVAALGAPAVLAIDAGTFVAAFALVAALVRPPGAAPSPPGEPAVAGGWRFLRRDAWMRPATAAAALSQGAFMAMVAAIPALAFASYQRDAHLAGLLLGAWGAGAAAGALLAYRLVASHDLRRLAVAASAAQAAPLWVLVSDRSPGVAAVALAVSGVANGVRSPSVQGINARRVPARVRAQTMTVHMAIVLGTGFVALLLAAPALGSLGLGPVWAGVAALQTATALLLARAALRLPADAVGPPSGHAAAPATPPRPGAPAPSRR